MHTRKYSMMRLSILRVLWWLLASVDAASTVRYRARVAYDGHHFQGFQWQTRTPHRHCRTVQGVLEDVLHRRLLNVDLEQQQQQQQRVIKVVAAGRTDAGVHARGQAVHFDVPLDRCSKGERLFSDEDVYQLCQSLNQMMPPDVRLWNLQRVPSDHQLNEQQQHHHVDDCSDESTVDKTSATVLPWNVLYNSTKKLYSYRLSLAAVMDPLQRYARWHPVQAQCINVDKLRRVLQCYEGTHDFRAFAGAVEQAEKRSGGAVSTIRTVYSVELIREEDEDDGTTTTSNNNNNYRIDFLLKGALYKQVRTMVGTAVDVCTGKVTEDDFLRLLPQQPDAQPEQPLTRVANRSKPAPPHGLTLEHVYFDDPSF